MTAGGVIRFTILYCQRQNLLLLHADQRICHFLRQIRDYMYSSVVKDICTLFEKDRYKLKPQKSRSI